MCHVSVECAKLMFMVKYILKIKSKYKAVMSFRQKNIIFRPFTVLGIILDDSFKTPRTDKTSSLLRRNPTGSLR